MNSEFSSTSVLRFRPSVFRRYFDLPFCLFVIFVVKSLSAFFAFSKKL
jgi:hypothetical protein